MSHSISCPYCGESFDTNIDTSQGNQAYIEDCYVCCRPIQFYLEVDHNGDFAGLQVQRDDE